MLIIMLIIYCNLFPTSPQHFDSKLRTIIYIYKLFNEILVKKCKKVRQMPYAAHDSLNLTSPVCNLPALQKVVLTSD